MKARLLEIITQSALFLATGPVGYGCAEDTSFEADRYMLNNASHFHGTPPEPEFLRQDPSRVC